MRPAPRILLSFTLTAMAACSDEAGRFRTPTQPELLQPTPAPAPIPPPTEFDGIWSGTVAFESVTNVTGVPQKDCFASGLADHFGTGGAVKLTIDSPKITFQRLPKEFGTCSGVYSPYWGSEWDIWCGFRIPFEVNCSDGTSVLAWFPDLEDDLGFEFERRGDREIAFDFVEVFTPIKGNPHHEGSYWVTFRFELSR